MLQHWQAAIRSGQNAHLQFYLLEASFPGKFADTPMRLLPRPQAFPHDMDLGSARTGAADEPTFFPPSGQTGRRTGCWRGGKRGIPGDTGAYKHV